MEELNPQKDVGSSAVGAPASNGSNHTPTSAPAMDPQSGDPPYCDDDFDIFWSFRTVTTRDVLNTFLCVVVCIIFVIGCFAPFSESFFDIE